MYAHTEQDLQEAVRLQVEMAATRAKGFPKEESHVVKRLIGAVVVICLLPFLWWLILPILLFIIFMAALGAVFS